MLKRMFAHGQSLGWEEVWVGAEPDNAPARKLYESFGREPAEAFVMDLDKL